MTLCAVCLPAMPVVTLAGSEENSMGRGGLDQSGRRRLYEASPNGPADPDDGNGGRWMSCLRRTKHYPTMQSRRLTIHLRLNWMRPMSRNFWRAIPSRMSKLLCSRCSSLGQETPTPCGLLW